MQVELTPNIIREVTRCRFDRLSEEQVRGMLLSIHEALWDPDSPEYPNNEVSGADFIEAVCSVFAEEQLGPVTGRRT